MDRKEIKKLDLPSIHYDEDGNALPGFGSIKETVVCLRPAHRSGVPQIYAERKGNKVISHNYGHGGAGWSLVFGAVEKAIENFEKLQEKLDKNMKISVVGFGCIGLVTALTLLQKGYKNIVLIGERFLQTASFHAGGLFDYTVFSNNTEDSVRLLNDIFEKTFDTYQEIINRKHAFLTTGARNIDYYTNYYQEGASLHYLSTKGKIPPIKKVKVSVSGSSTFYEQYHFKTVHISTEALLHSMYSNLAERGIKFEYRKLNSFDEVDSVGIFNCSGLGSRELNNDKDVYPVCGHGIVLKDQSIKDFDYILGILNTNDTASGLGSIYFIPKSSGFIGGTFMKDYDGSDDKLNKDIITKLLERAKQLYNGSTAIEPQFKPKF